MKDGVVTAKALSNSAVVNNIEYLIEVPDMNGTEDGAPGIAAGSTITVVISPAAGITNATASGDKGPVGAYTSKQGTLVYGTVSVNLSIALNDYDTNRNKTLTVLGRGFQDGTTATIYLDTDVQKRQDLVSVLVASDDTFEAHITVLIPPFVPGTGNTIYVEDGNDDPNISNRVQFEVEGLLTISPTSAAVGDEVDITLEDWPNDGVVPVNAVTIGNTVQKIVGSTDTSSGGSVSGGSASFRIEVDSATPSGTSDILVNTPLLLEKDDKKITISGAILEASPATAVPNQAITVSGRGFTGDGTINATDEDNDSVVTLGQDDEALDRDDAGGSGTSTTVNW